MIQISKQQGVRPPHTHPNIIPERESAGVYAMTIMHLHLRLLVVVKVDRTI